MKKILLSIITMIYMTVSSGIAMETHYCMGKSAGIDLFTTKDNKCSKCGMKEKKRGCCHNEHRLQKLDDSHKNISNDINLNAEWVAAVSTYTVFKLQHAVITLPSCIDNNSPPAIFPPVYIMNCVFRI